MSGEYLELSLQRVGDGAKSRKTMLRTAQVGNHAFLMLPVCQGKLVSPVRHSRLKDTQDPLV